MDFGRRSFIIIEVCMDFKPCLKAQNSVTIHLNITKLGKVTNFNVIFLVMIFIFQYD